jgi:3-deoxy-D-manno-octulosonic-acid transferase
LHVAADHRERGAALRAQHVATRRFVWVAEHHDGEEQQVLQAHALLRAAGVDALLVLAPRHPPRSIPSRSVCARRGWRIARRSAGDVLDTDVLLLDTLGELSLYYAAADVAFVGGSLVPIGGHNLLEPAALGIATLTGPHVFNAEDIAAALVAEGAVACIDDGETLQRALLTRWPTTPTSVHAAGRVASQWSIETAETLERGRARLARCSAQLRRPGEPAVHFFEQLAIEHAEARRNLSTLKI